jgi:hypothetical protein
MATYFVASGGSNTSPYDTWAKASTSLATALAAASTGDIVVIQYNAVPSTDAEIAVDTTYVPAASIKIISASNDGTAAYTPTAMGAANWIGNSTSGRSVGFGGPYAVYMYGVTLRVSGSAADTVHIASDNDSDYLADNCYFWNGNAASASTIRLGPSGTNNDNAYLVARNCTLRLGNAAHSIRIAATVRLESCTLSSDGSAPTGSLFRPTDSTDAGGCGLTAIGCDFSYAGSCPIVGACSTPPQDFKFIQCKLGTSYVLLGTQTVNSKASARAWLYDCDSGDTQGIYAYADSLGSVVLDTGIYYTTGIGKSWKITTTAYATDISPFESPFMDWYNTYLSGMTPRFEILRNDSTSAYTNNEVWSDWFSKNTTGTAKSTFYTDRVSLNLTVGNQENGAGLSAWTGESGTAWSGKLDSGASIGPQEIGSILGRICVALPSTTFYVDPQIRNT